MDKIEIKAGKVATIAVLIVATLGLLIASSAANAGGLSAVVVKGGSQFFDGEVKWMVKGGNKLIYQTGNKSFSLALAAGDYEAGVKCPSGEIRTRMFTVGSGSATTNVVVSCD